MFWSGVGALALALAVIFGAFGAHELRPRLDAYSLTVYDRAVFYHFIHALGLLITPLLLKTPAASTRVCVLLTVGIVLFSGSLYAVALSGVSTLGIITPFGGLSLIAAWLLLAWELLRNRY